MTEGFVLIAYRILALALIVHFIVTLIQFNNFDGFTNDLESKQNDTQELKWCISMFNFLTAYQNTERNKHELRIVELYFDYCIFALTFYLLNVFFINPATICLKTFVAKQKPVEYTSANSSSFSYNVQNVLERYQSVRVSSTNYFSEINIQTLKHQYTSNLDNILVSKRRLLLYYRIAHINEQSEMGKIFAKKYNNFYPYFLSLIDNKQKIEKYIN